MLVVLLVMVFVVWATVLIIVIYNVEARVVVVMSNGQFIVVGIGYSCC